MQIPANPTLRLARYCSLTLLSVMAFHQTSIASQTPEPTGVTIAGNLQEALGCPGNWQPDCAVTHLTFETSSSKWFGEFEIPAGDYQYKAPLNDSWDENYGLNAQRGGANIPLSLANTQQVRFYYDHQTNWITDNVNSRIAIAAGNFQQYVGCSDHWQPFCLNSWLQDPDGDDIYTFTTTAIPAGDYQGKVSINQSWDENYGANGVFNGANINFNVPEDNAEMVFRFESSSNLLTISAGGEPNGNLAVSRAQWLSKDVLAWDTSLLESDRIFLHASDTAELALDQQGVLNGESYELSLLGALPADLQAKFSHLSNYTAIDTTSLSDALKRELATQQLAVSVVDENGELKDATSIQMPGLLDTLFVFDGTLGPIVEQGEATAHVWAPTAQNVELLIFDSAEQIDAIDVLPMTLDAQTGVWSTDNIAAADRKYYQYRVTVYSTETRQIEINDVTDPYSLSLSANGRLSQFVDLADNDLKPRGWNFLRKPRARAPEDMSLYELHVRDFSISDESVPEVDRGTFNAFGYPRSNGMRHLRRLAKSGLSHIHLLPVFDIATVNENKDQQQVISQDLSLLAPNSEEQQAAVAEIQNQDGFNWGYDPHHYTVPDGSYSSNPNGVTRIKEFRSMVKNLNRSGLRVIMDVVYNHTSSFGQFDNSVLDKIVPGYYHRYNADGGIEMSTCCANTASENRMMEKLMIDSLLTWAKAYKVDGFRFDLMGHHSKQNMLNVQAALTSLTLAEDGVDGNALYIYGEGWNFGEVANNARFEQATQVNMAGTGIGTFDDRGRDAIRGGNPFGGFQDQGFGNGLFTNPNGVGDSSSETLMVLTDRVRSSLTAGLRDYAFENADGVVRPSSEIDYNGQPTGYTDDPQELISYASAHDNETLLDALQLKAPATSSIADRARMQNFSNALILFGQGVPFIHAGQDFLRSKSIDRDSFNSGDWFNVLDFTFRETGWGRGLPIADKNEDNWPIMSPLLADESLTPSRWLMIKTSVYFRELLRIRYSSPLFRLKDKQSIIDNVAFLNTGVSQIPGLVAMQLKGKSGWKKREIVVLFNGSNESVEFSHDELESGDYRLHPYQRWSIDTATRESKYDDGVFTVPAMTTAVFIKRKHR